MGMSSLSFFKSGAVGLKLDSGSMSDSRHYAVATRAMDLENPILSDPCLII